MGLQAAWRPGGERRGVRGHRPDAPGARPDRRVLSSLSVVVVTHDSREAVSRTLPAIEAELEPGDELIVVDNRSADDTVTAVRELHPGARVIETGENLGFGGGCNRGAREARGELLLFLNPDAAPAPGFREAIVAPASEGPGWAAWQGLVTAQGGQVVNSRGGVVHFTGIAWAGGAGEPAGVEVAVGEPAFVSGACLAMPREGFLATGGFPPEFFLYHEDVDLSLRLRLEGGRLGVATGARVDHDYEFAKGAAKWRHLERNRWATVIRVYPPALLVVVAPALLATELALVGISIAGGWFRQKALAWADVVRALPRLCAERRRIQRGRVVSVGEFAASLTPELGSAYLGAAGRSPLLRALLGAYWRVVLLVVGARRG